MSDRFNAAEIDEILGLADSGVAVNQLMRRYGFTRAEYARWRRSKRDAEPTTTTRTAPKASEPQGLGIRLQAIGVVLAIAASFAAVASTALTYWFWYDERRAPFAPLVAVGRVGFMFDSVEPRPAEGFDLQKGRAIGAVLASINATHSGGAHGTIQDVVLRLSHAGGHESWLFSPHMELSEEALLGSFAKDQQPDVSRWFKAAFAGIHLPRDTSVNRFLLLLPDVQRNNSHNRSEAPFRLKGGESEVAMLIRFNGGTYKIAGKQNFRIESKQGLDGVLVFPVSMESRAARAAID